MAELNTWTMGLGLLAYFMFSGIVLSGIASEKQNTINSEITYNSSFSYAGINSSSVFTGETSGLSFMKALSITITEDIGWFGNLIFVFIPSLLLVLWFIFLLRGI